MAAEYLASSGAANAAPTFSDANETHTWTLTHAAIGSGEHGLACLSFDGAVVTETEVNNATFTWGGVAGTVLEQVVASFPTAGGSARQVLVRFAGPIAADSSMVADFLDTDSTGSVNNSHCRVVGTTGTDEDSFGTAVSTSDTDGSVANTVTVPGDGFVVSFGIGVDSPAPNLAWSNATERAAATANSVVRTEVATGTASNPSFSYTPSIIGDCNIVSVPVSPAAGGAFDLAADAGSYALTGSAATLTKGKQLAADAGSYALTGATASLEHGREVVADAASYALTGSDATARFGQTLAADAGAYSLAGTVAATIHDWKASAEAGAYALTGTAASPEHGRRVTAGEGSYALSGTDAAPELGREVVADAGSYALSGADATLKHVWNLGTEAGTYALAGAAVSPLHGWEITAAVGSYAITGAEAFPSKGLRLAAGSGSYLLTGGDMTPTHIIPAATRAALFRRGTSTRPAYRWKGDS